MGEAVLHWEFYSAGSYGNDPKYQVGVLSALVRDDIVDSMADSSWLGIFMFL